MIEWILQLQHVILIEMEGLNLNIEKLFLMYFIMFMFVAVKMQDIIHLHVKLQKDQCININYDPDVLSISYRINDIDIIDMGETYGEFYNNLI